MAGRLGLATGCSTWLLGCPYTIVVGFIESDDSGEQGVSSNVFYRGLV